MNESFHLLVTTTLPDDAVWDENDEVVQPGGHAVLKTIVEQLRALGFKVHGPFIMHFYGWECVMSRDGKRFSVLVQCWEGGPWLVTIMYLRTFAWAVTKREAGRKIAMELEPWFRDHPLFPKVIFGFDPQGPDSEDLTSPA